MKIVASFFALVLGATVASAASYQVFDHPEGAKSSSYDYGLRMESAPGSGAADYWSFQDLSGKSTVVLSVDVAGGTGTVSGTMRHNLDNSVWNLSLTLVGVTSLSGIGAGADSFGAISYNGTLSSGAVTYDLLGKGKSVGGTSYEWTYFSSDPGGATDWRVPNITAGWVGSLDGGATMTSGTNDFIGVLAPIPVPAAGFLLLSGFVALGLTRRRKRAS